MELLQAYKIQISDGKKQYESLISNVELDIHKRKLEIMGMANNIINAKVPLCLVTQPDIKFLMPPKAVSQFLNALSVDNCDRPAPPVIILEKVTFDTLTVSWQSEFDESVNSMSVRKATEYQLYYAKY
eukprot:132794_1